MSDLLLSFYGDDFTGSTDAMEALALGGLRTVLFTKPPTRQQLTRYDGLRAFGVAGMTRSMPPDEMEKALRPSFAAMRECGAPIVHYKVCSTFDSSPTVGSIGRAIDVGAEVFGAEPVPVIVGAPSLGRYCVFGTLFVRNAGDAAAHRLDRHPSMSRHPTTPMNEADLRLHLAKQTGKSIGLIDVVQLTGDAAEISNLKFEIVLIDLLEDAQLATVGRLIAKSPFVVGSSGVESALVTFWEKPAKKFPLVSPAGPIFVLCGSRSPVTESQIAWAESRGFASIAFQQATFQTIPQNRSVIIHIRHAHPGDALAKIARDLLQTGRYRRMIVAGGDTSGQIARGLNIESLEMIGELARGAPLCRATAPNSPADGVEVVFKGGQIGPVDFFGMVEKGTAHG